MPFLSASTEVGYVLQAGGLRYAEQLLSLGFSNFDAIVDLLRARFTPIGQLPYAYQVYQAVVNRARSALLSGRQFESWDANVPFPKEMHVGTLGLSDRYAYTSVQTFFNPATGREFTYPFQVVSDVPLSLAEARGRAEQMVSEFLSEGVTLKAAAGADNLQSVGLPTFKDALVRINP